MLKKIKKEMSSEKLEILDIISDNDKLEINNIIALNQVNEFGLDNCLFLIKNYSTILKRKLTKISLKYFSSGSNGVILYDINDEDYVYKISYLYDGTDISGANLCESIFLNYFKINYPEAKNENYFPVQNISTEIMTLEEFLNYFTIDEQMIKKFNHIGIKLQTDYIILNKMLNYDKNLYQSITSEKINLLDNWELIVKQILKGIGLIHQENFIHGDLKTMNIVFDGYFCKITDFGGIKSSKPNFYEKSCTISFRPPEDLFYEHESNKNRLFKGTSRVSYKPSGITGEIWSIGMILLELISTSNPINILYSKLSSLSTEKDSDIKEESIEENIYTILKTKKSINILGQIDINKYQKYPNITNSIDIIQKTLFINPEERNITVSQLYLELFKEDINLPKNSKQREIILSNTKYKLILNNFRKIIYPKLIQFLTKYKKLNSLELIINIIDRFLSIKLNFNDLIIENMCINITKNLDQIILLIASAVLIGVSIVYKKYLIIKDFIELINSFNFTTTKFANNNIKNIMMNLINILNVLKYDIINVNLDYNIHP